MNRFRTADLRKSHIYVGRHCRLVFIMDINKQFSQVVDTLFVSPIINSNNKYTLLLSIYKSYHDPANTQVKIT
jgi:hypothetical protein